MFNRIIPFAVLVIVGCVGSTPDPWDATSEPRVVATFAPLHCFAMNVVGESRQVRGLLSTQGPHHADPPVSQAAMLAKSNVLFANGVGIDDSIVRKMHEAMGTSGPKVYRLGDNLPREMLLAGNACAACKEEGHNHGPHDGHVWLGIDQAKFMVMDMAERLKSLHPNGPWEVNARNYCEKLDRLKTDGLTMLKEKKERTILPFHGSMTYFAKTFDLKMMDPIQTVPGQEPTGQALSDLVEKCKKESVRVIAVEPQYGAETSAKALQRELISAGVKDVTIIILDPLETARENEFNAEWYVKKMRANLDTLAKSLR